MMDAREICLLVYQGSQFDVLHFEMGLNFLPQFDMLG